MPLARFPCPQSFWLLPPEVCDRCSMTCWRERRLAHLSVCHPVHPRPLRSPKLSSTHNALLRCVTTEIPRTSPPPLLSEWAAPLLALAPAKTCCLPTTAPNRCPPCRRKGNLATRSSQFSLELKKVWRDNSNETHSVSNLFITTGDVMIGVLHWRRCHSSKLCRSHCFSFCLLLLYCAACVKSFLV